MADLAITYPSLQAAIRDWLNEPSKDVDEAIKSGYRMALGACRGPGQKGRHRWSFLQPISTLVIWPSVVVAAANPVVGDYTAATGLTELTSTADSFYPSMVGHDIVVTAIGTFTITAYTSAKKVVVSGNAATAGATWAMTSNARFSLPTDFGSLASDFTFEAGVLNQQIDTVPVGDVQRAHQALVYVTEPSKVCIVPRAAVTGHDPDQKTLYEAWFWPTPSTLRTLTYRYNLRCEMPSALIGFVGPDEFHGLVQTACLAYAEVLWRGGPGDWMKMYQDALDQYMTEDQGTLPRNHGYNGDTSDHDWPEEHYRLNDVTNVGYR